MYIEINKTIYRFSSPLPAPSMANTAMMYASAPKGVEYTMKVLRPPQQPCPRWSDQSPIIGLRRDLLNLVPKIEGLQPQIY
jgi:hypothetical protein